MSRFRKHVAGVVFLAALVCSLSVARGSEIPDVLTLEEAIRLATERHPSLQAEKDEIAIREADVVDRGKRLNPAFTVDVENYPYFSSSGGPYFQNSEITTRLDYEIETRGRRGLRTDAARQAVEVWNAIYQDRLRRFRLQVQRAFYRVVLAESNLEVAKSVLEQTDQVISLNRVRYEQGEISELELRRVEMERLRFVDEMYRSRLELQNAKSTLLSLLNAPDLGRDIQVIGVLPIAPGDQKFALPPRFTFSQLKKLAREHRPDLAAALREEQRADTETRLQSAIRSPNLTVGGGYKRNGLDNSLVFGLTVPVKLFNRNQGKILRAQAERRRAAHRAAAVRNRIELEIRKAVNAVEINRKRVEYIENQHLKRAEKTRALTLEAYRMGGATLMDYLDAQRRYRDTVRIYNRALYERRISLYELAGAVGTGGN